MAYVEMSPEQRRQLVDAQQLYAAWRPSNLHVARTGSLFWNTSKGRRYLYRKKSGVSTSLGPETPDLIAKKARRDEMVKRNRSLSRRIEKAAPVNKAIGIARMPAIASRIVRELDREGLLGSRIVVAGTNALFAYEAACGVLIGAGHVATGDADLLWGARQSLSLTASGDPAVGVLSILKRVDPSFRADCGYNATNDDGYIVDLICPDAPDFAPMQKETDLEAVGMPGAEWLLDAPRFEQVIVGGDGVPLRMVTPDPRTFALHKLWVSRRADRTPVKKPRDLAHAAIVAELSATYLGRKLTLKDMAGAPAPLKSVIKDLNALAPSSRTP